MARYGEVVYSFFPPLTRMVKTLVIITAGVFAVTYVLGSLPSATLQYYCWLAPVSYLGLRPYMVLHRFYIWEPVTYLFLHGGFFHIFFNLFALWMFGADLERQWGPRKFARYYFLTGVGAGVLDVLLRPSSLAPVIGCSGAIYGILLAYGVLFPNRPIYLWMIIPIKAKWFVALMGGIELLSELSGSAPGISHLAHLGGILIGFIYLRGRGLTYRAELRYHDWRRSKLKRQFDSYMRRQEKKDDSGRWIN
ncbi:MAG: DUF1751 domain-containing protein [Acidobacteria bacterium]|nr:MAG: DUF1751 domain-containing protein [Acidobacteriota bacterium]